VSQNEILERKTGENGQMMEFSIVNWPVHCSDKSMGKGGNMKHILLSTIQSFVFVVLVSAISFAVNAQDKGSSFVGAPSKDVYLLQSCDGKQTQVTDASQKLRAIAATLVVRVV